MKGPTCNEALPPKFVVALAEVNDLGYSRRALRNEHLKCILVNALQYMFYFICLRHCSIDALTQVNDIFQVASEIFTWLLGSRLQALFRAKSSNSGTSEDLADFCFERWPAWDVGFVVVKPQVSDAGEVERDGCQFRDVVPFVVATDTFIRCQPVINVVIIGAAENGRIALTERARADVLGSSWWRARAAFGGHNGR